MGRRKGEVGRGKKNGRGTGDGRRGEGGGRGKGEGGRGEGGGGRGAVLHYRNIFLIKTLLFAVVTFLFLFKPS